MILDRKIINEKYLIGDGLTDEELDMLLSSYRRLIKDIYFLDKDFSLFTKEINRRCRELKSFKDARNEHF